MKIYRDNIKTYDAKLLALSKVLKRTSFLRLFIFVISGIVLLYLFSIKTFTLFFIVFPISIILFALALTHHSKVAYLRKHTSFLKKINESELLREDCNLEGFDSGHTFINPKHPYTADLDIFGPHSVFQLVNRTTTESGSILLSEWLSEPAPSDEIPFRQEAIKELAQKLDWRQHFQASGMHFHNKKSDYYKLLSWVEAPVALLKYRPILMAAAISLPVLLLLGFYFFYAKLDSPNPVIYLLPIILILIVNAIVLRKVKPHADNIVETSTKNLETLKGYRTLIQKIQTEDFRSKKLCGLQSLLMHGNYSAHKEIIRLCRTLEFSQQRNLKGQPFSGNQFYTILNSFLLLDIHLILDTEKWKKKNKEALKSWAEAVSEFEVITSFAGFCYSNPSYTFPEITQKNNYVHFEMLGHPLLNAKSRVCNTFHSEGHGEVVMVTGSNMGGKSTFLRAVGVNIVLGLAGAPCCSTGGQISSLKLYSSMRTEDNLRKGISSFYAELTRIENLLKLIERNDNVFFLLDEVFKGTNSEDRHRGGFSLIHQMSELKTSGIIATHDIELAKLSGNKMLVTNYSFNSEIREGSMFFSYELQQGICDDFNASELMEKIGIKIIPNLSKSEIP